VSVERLVSKYIASAEHVFSEIEIVKACTSLNTDRLTKVLESAKAYLADAKYYRDEKRFETSLASVAYCEGLLDALKLLGIVKFEWPMEKEQESEK
jgi:hypothetical protein